MSAGSLHFILNPFGSAGDVLPFVHLGRLLRNRGHRVTMVCSAMFDGPARDAGLASVTVGTRAEFESLSADPAVWDARRGTPILLRETARWVWPFFDAIRTVADTSPPGRTLLVGSGLALGARLARETLGVPLVTVHLQPVCFLSAQDPPIIPGYEWVRLMPRSIRRVLLSMPNPFDWGVARGLRDACRRAGVAPPRSVLREWWHSPDGVLALFPEWFARPAPDWPAQTRVHGFLLEDLARHHPFPPDLDEFLSRGNRPVVFTPGSAMRHAQAFFEAALGACTRLGSRAVFATPHREHLPTRLPPSVHVTAYAPFSLLLPRASALAHHGGIGTMSQGFAAGIPQLVMPMAYDQPDNARRLVALGAGAALAPRRFTAATVASALDALRDDPAVAAACRRCAGLARAAPPADALVSWLVARAGGPAAKGG